MPFNSAVSPPTDYSAPLINFLPAGNLLNDYWTGKQQQFDDQQRQRLLQLQQPINTTDPRQVEAELLRRGGAQFADPATLQALQPAPVSPLLGGGLPPGAPPASTAAVAPTAPAKGGGDQEGSVAALVMDRLPANSTQTGQLINTVATTLRVDPNVSLSPSQTARAGRLIDASVRSTPTRFTDLFGTTPAAPSPAAASPPRSAAAPTPLTNPILPPGFNDPRAAVLALRREASRLNASTNPGERRQAPEAEAWADRLEKQLQPIAMHAGTTMVDPGSGQTVYTAPSANPATAAFQQFMAEHPDATAEEQQAFIARSHAGRSAIAMYMQRYLEEHPNASAEEVGKAAQLFHSEGTAIARFMGGGKQSDTIRSLGVVVDHIGTMQRLADALHNGDYPRFNQIAQAWAAETGQPAPQNFSAAATIVGGEIVKAIVGSGAGTLEDREKVRSAFSRASSPAQFSGVINDTVRPLMVGQLNGLRRQFVVATGLPGEKFDEMLSPEAQAFLGRRGASGGQGTTAAPAGGGSATAPDGSNVTIWVRRPDGSLGAAQ